jgi:mannose-1-phosphate guanylyltransferase
LLLNIEKPDAATAATYVADCYPWNSGNFLFHAATMLSEIERARKQFGIRYARKHLLERRCLSDQGHELLGHALA